jgi:hypothetical protein
VKYKQKISLDKLLLYELKEFDLKMYKFYLFLSTLSHIEKTTALSGLFLTMEGKITKTL